MSMLTEDLIDTATDEHRTYFYGVRERLIRAGIAAPAMFPQGGEHWRSGGPSPDGSGPQWSVHRGCGGKYLVVWEHTS